MIIKNKIYSYEFKDTTTKALRDKIVYYAGVNKDVDIEFKDEDIYIKNKNVGRKVNAAFVGKIIKCGKDCKFEGIIPDEKSNKLMLIFFAAWYIIYVFFTFGKISVSSMVVSYLFFLVFMIAVAASFLITHKKSLDCVKKFIENLQ